MIDLPSLIVSPEEYSRLVSTPLSRLVVLERVLAPGKDYKVTLLGKEFVLHCVYTDGFISRVKIVAQVSM